MKKTRVSDKFNGRDTFSNHEAHEEHEGESGFLKELLEKTTIRIVQDRSQKPGASIQNAPAQLCVDSRTPFILPQRPSQPFQLLTPEF